MANDPNKLRFWQWLWFETGIWKYFPSKQAKLANDEFQDLFASHIRWLQDKESHAVASKQLALINTDLREYSPLNRPMSDAVFIGCNFQGVEISRDNLGHAFGDAVYRYCQFEKANLVSNRSWSSTQDCDVIFQSNLVGVTGLFGESRAFLGEGVIWSPNTSLPRFRRWAPTKVWGDFPSWAIIRFAGDLPLFGLSNLGLLAILLYSVSAKRFNALVEWLQSRFGTTSSTDQQPYELWYRDLLDSGISAPAPATMGLLLTALASLLFASLIYGAWCPEEVKKGTWLDHKTGSADHIAYLSANYSRLFRRWICFLLYAWGGGFSLWYLLGKIWNAIWFFFGH